MVHLRLITISHLSTRSFIVYMVCLYHGGVSYLQGVGCLPTFADVITVDVVYILYRQTGSLDVYTQVLMYGYTVM